MPSHVLYIKDYLRKGVDNMGTLNEWLREFGYVWVEGQERIAKGMITNQEAQVQIAELLAEGAIKRG